VPGFFPGDGGGGGYPPTRVPKARVLHRFKTEMAHSHIMSDRGYPPPHFDQGSPCPPQVFLDVGGGTPHPPTQK